jgi:Zn-dependent peptidase ImmA (M78 family)
VGESALKRYDPYEHADMLGIRVEEQALQTTNGLWIAGERLIILRSRMRAVQFRSTLAHELGHVVLAHFDDRPKHEIQADRFAAENLIDLRECRTLMKWLPDCHNLAAELNVTTRLMRVYLNVHQLAV